MALCDRHYSLHGDRMMMGQLGPGQKRSSGWLCLTQTLQCPWRQDDDGTVGAGTEAQLRMALCDRDTTVSTVTG